MSDLIQALKDNEKPFGLMTEEMQAKAREIGMGDFERFVRTCEWIGCGDKHNFSRVEDSTYRLRHDYAEKPKLVECEVTKDYAGDLCVRVDEGDPDESDPWPLTACPNHPDFIGFKYEDGMVDIKPRLYKSEGNGYYGNINLDNFSIDDYEVLTPTHVLFKA